MVPGLCPAGLGKNPKATPNLRPYKPSFLFYRAFFPTLACWVFVFSSVSAPLPPPPPVLLPSSSPSSSSLTHSLILSLSPTHSLTHSMCTAKGSDVRPGVPPVSLRCSWSCRENEVSEGFDRFHSDRKVNWRGTLGQPDRRDFVKRCTTVRPTVALYLDELPD